MTGELTLSTFRLVFSAEKRVALPPLQRGDLIRGFFGISLRKLVCYDLSLDCRRCLLRQTCPYPPLFEPRALVDGPGWKDPPPPFVFRPDLEPPIVDAGNTFGIDMTLIGTAIDRLPYIVVALRGTPRAPGLAGGTLRLTRLLEVLPGSTVDVWRSQSTTVGAAQERERWTPGATTADAPRRIRIVFDSPTEIVEGGRTVRTPELSQIVRRLADRAESLAWAHCGGSLGFDRAGLAERCRARMVTSELAWVSASRKSSRTGQAQSLSGIAGWAEYEGDLSECYSLLKLGEKIHVGKDAAFGKGRLRVLAL